MSPCHHCGDAYLLDVLEVFPEERTFMFDTCCEGAHADALGELEMGVDRREFATWFKRCTGLEIRRYFGSAEAGGRYGNGGITLDWGLRLGTIKLKDAKAFCRQHHAHLSPDGTHRPPCGWRWGHAIFNGDELVAVAMVGRPVARMIDHKTIVEVNRVCVDRELPRELAWNACSMLYGAAVREAKRRGFKTVITYTKKDEKGTTLRAAGFQKVGETKKEKGWDRPSRRRMGGVTGQKDRWERRAAR